VISPSLGRYLHTRQHKRRITADYIHALSGIRTHDSSVREREDSSCLRSRGHRDRREIYVDLYHHKIYHNCNGRALAQAVSRRLPTAAARVRSCGISGGQSGTGADLLRVLRFPLPIRIPPTAPHSSAFIIWGWYNRSIRGRSTITVCFSRVKSGHVFLPVAQPPSEQNRSGTHSSCTCS
jgi:hypothetical protein